jgi:CubicO group peptidase (beta-lactamase class C family)
MTQRGEEDAMIRRICVVAAALLSHLPGGNTGARFQGFGLGVSVLIDLEQSPTPGSLGTFGWTGAATTLCQIDPKEQMVLLVFTQHFPHNERKLFERFLTCAYQALVD